MTIKKIKIGNRFEASAIALGCMRISNMSRKEIATLLQTALNCGVNFSIMPIFMAAVSQKLILPAL